MRKSSDPIQLPTIGTQISSSSNNRENYKKRQFRTVNIKKIETEKEEEKGQDELISNAYKNVINVISNLLDNINEEKTNGKSNLKYINESTQKQRRSFNKPQAKKFNNAISQTTIIPLNKFKKKNSINKSLLFNRKSFNEGKLKNLNLIRIDNLDASIRLDKSKKNIHHLQFIKSNNRLQVKNLFFKPMNKLKTKWTSTKALLSDYNKVDNESSFLSNVNKSNIEEGRLCNNNNKTNNSIASLLGSDKGIHLKIKSQK